MYINFKFEFKFNIIQMFELFLKIGDLNKGKLKKEKIFNLYLF